MTIKSPIISLIFPISRGFDGGSQRSLFLVGQENTYKITAK